jgi:23S rRNA (guanine745-N1)-methyltransferase
VTAKLPYADGAFQALLNVFAPHNPPEFARVLTPGGFLVVVIPTRQHLRELRDVAPLLNIEQDKQQRVVERLSERFAFAGATTLEYDIELSGADLTHLAQMTPSARHFSPQTLDGLREQTNLRPRVGFALLRFVRI